MNAAATTLRPWKRAPRERKSPPRLTDEQWHTVITAFLNGGNIAGAAYECGFGREWLSTRIKAHPDLCEDIENAKQIAISRVRSAIFESAKIPGKPGDVARIFILKNLDGWTDERRIQVSGKINVEVYPKLLDDSFSSDVEEEAQRQLVAMGTKTLPESKPATIDVTPEPAPDQAKR